MSLSQEPAFTALKKFFVCGFTDITNKNYSGMSGRHTTYGNAINTTNGAGPKNLQLFMLSSDGTVLHCLPGFWNARDLVYEMAFAAELNDIWTDRSLSASQKRAQFKSMQLAHAKDHPKGMKRRSHMQGFDQKYEAQHKLNTSDTIKNRAAVKEALAQGKHLGRFFKTTDVIAHERMASRPFVHYSRFDVDNFSDYGKPIYDKDEDARDYRTGEKVSHGKKSMIGNPVVMAKRKYGKNWKKHVSVQDRKMWGTTNNSSESEWTSKNQSNASGWGNGYQSQSALWGVESKKQHKKKGR